MKIVIWFALAAVLLAVAAVGAAQFGLLIGTTPPDLGVTNGRLKPPSDTPNSVSSQARLYPGHPQLAYASIAPLTFTGDGEAAMARLSSLLSESAGTVIVTQRSDYIQVRCSTPLLKFADDVEFLLDRQSHSIEFRSASRLGRKDFGVNRARMEAIRAKFQH